MGITHARMGTLGLRREFTLFDEIAIWKRICCRVGTFRRTHAPPAALNFVPWAMEGRFREARARQEVRSQPLRAFPGRQVACAFDDHRTGIVASGHSSTGADRTDKADPRRPIEYKRRTRNAANVDCPSACLPRLAMAYKTSAPSESAISMHRSRICCFFGSIWRGTGLHLVAHDAREVAARASRSAAPAGLRLRGLGARIGVEQRQPVDPLRGLAQDFHRDDAAHARPASAKRGGAWARISAASASMCRAP